MALVAGCEPVRPTAGVVGVITAVVGVLGGLTLLAEQHPGGPLAQDVLDVGVLVVATAAVPLLWVGALPAAIGLALLAAVSPVATPASTVALVWVARSRPLATAAVVAAVGIGTHLLRGLWRPVADLPTLWWVVLVVLAHAALLSWGALGRSRAMVMAALRERARRAEDDRDRAVAAARTQERSRIAREMHDVLAHRLSLLATYAGALEFRPDAPPDQVARAAAVVRGGVHQALDELREVIGLLRYEPTAEGGAVPAPPLGLDGLSRLAQESEAAGSAVELDVRVPDQVPGLLGRTVYRVVQEGLTNARKHAPGRPVSVLVDGSADDGVEVTVSNTVPEVAPAGPPGSGTGLVGLTERVELLGGRLHHGVRTGRFTLEAWLPWPT